MTTQNFACGDCHMILADKVDQCPHHPSARVSTDWNGFVIIMQPERSEIAKRLNVTVPGQYALKVNIYT
jgi:DNA-directed RNA polymerase subunit E"